MKLYLHQPTVVFAARVNQANFTYPISQVTYDTVTTGTYSVVGNSQTILFGTSAGASDLGMSRVRLDPTSTVLYFGLSPQGVHIGEVNLADNCYITILSELRVWSKPAYIDMDTLDTLMDGIAYTNQNSQPQPVANAGPPFAATIDPITEVITVELSAADSFTVAPAATIASYYWDIKDGTVTAGDIDEVSLTVTFPAGFRYVSVLIADSNAKAHTAYIPILAIDPDNDPTIEAFQITRHTITASGQELDIRLLEDVSASAFPEGGMLMVIDGEPVDGTDHDNILFWGWADTEDADIDAGDTGLLRDTTIHCLDVANRMKQLPGSAQVITHAASSTQWAEYPAPNMDKFAVWLLYWQTTALALADFTWSGTGTDYAFAESVADGSNLWDQVDRKCQEMVPDYRLTCNRRGQIRMLPDPMFQETADRTSTTQANITVDDWQALRFTAERRPRYWRIEGQAVIVGNTVSTSVFCFAPGKSQGQGEQNRVMGENLAENQTALNNAIGHHYARLNAPQGMFSVTLPVSANSAYDPARMDWVTLTISAAVAAQRGLTFSEARFLLHQLDVRYNYGRGGVTRTNTLKLERETTGIPAVTFVPALAANVDDGDYNTPPAVDLPDFDGGLSATPQNIALITDDGRFIITNDFGSSPPTWTVDNSIQGSFSGTGMAWVVDPFSSLYRTGSGTVDGFYVTSTDIYKVTDVFGTPSATSLHTFAESITTSGGRWRSIACSFGRFEAVESDNPWIMAVSNYNSGITTRQGTHIIYSRDGGASWSSEIEVSAFKPTGSFSARYWPVIWMSPRTPGYAIVVAKTQTGTIGGTGAFYTTDWGATWAVLTTPAVVTSPQVTTGGLAGGALYVPWEGNVDENVIFHGYEVEQSSDWQRYLYKTTGASSVDVTPSAGNYGPRWGLFAVRAFDGDSNHMVAVLANSNNDDDILTESTALFTSTDAGLTWTSRLGPTTTAANAQYVAQAAFSGTDENVIFAFGNEGYIRLSTDGGANFTDKRGSMSFSGGESILALVGGDA